MPELAGFSIVETLDAAWFIERILLGLAWALLCNGPPRGRRGWGRLLADFAVLSLILGGCELPAQILFPSLFLIVRTLVNGLAGFAYLYLRSDYYWKSKLVMWSSMFACCCALSSIGGMFSFLTGEFLVRGAMEGVVRCLIATLGIPLALYLHAFNFQKYQSIPFSGMSVILIGDASVLVFVLLEIFWAGADYRITVSFAVAYICILGMTLVAVWAMHDMCAEQADIIALQAESQRLQGERELFRATEATLEDLRCIRHDLKNQYSYMQILLSQKRYGELEAYFQQLTDHLPAQLNYIDCGNRAVNAILNMEMGKAKKEDVQMEHQLVVPPVLPFAEDDLCALLANLLDNAIEECARLRQEKDLPVSLRLEIYPHRTYLYIMCRNTTDRKQLQRRGTALSTTKADGRLHGYGTRIISKIAEKYNGCAEFGLDSGNFVAKIMIDMLSGETGGVTA